MDVKLVICDVCDTLYKSNTTFDFIRYLLKKEKGLKYFLFNIFTSKLSPVFYFMVLSGKLTQTDVIRKSVLKLLKGKTDNELNSAANSFYDDFLIQRENREVFELIDQNKNNNVLLVSSSIDPIIGAIAGRHQIHFYSSVLEKSESKTTGKLLTDLTGRKHEVVSREMKKNKADHLMVITDNKSDFDLVAMASERFVIISKESEKDFWAQLNPTFIRV